MSDVRAALFLDFDNVFSGLFNLDPEVAVKFAADPGAWLRRLATTFAPAGSRRWLILRCYLNPSGWVPHRDGAGEPARLFFSRYRPSFVRAGFEVIDCPRYSGTKNAADIRIGVRMWGTRPSSASSAWTTISRWRTCGSAKICS